MLKKSCQVTGGLLTVFVTLSSYGQSELEISNRDYAWSPGDYRKVGYSVDIGVGAEDFDLIKEAGGPRLWDFSSVPAEQVMRYDYLDVEEARFDGAIPDLFEYEIPEGTTVVERRRTDPPEITDFSDWMFLDFPSCRGRMNYGGVVQDLLLGQVPAIFVAPSQDFPRTMKLGDEPFRSIAVFGLDLGVAGTSTGLEESAEVDGHGIVLLPDPLGPVPAIRVKVEGKVTNTVTFGQDTFDEVKYYKAYRWFAEDLGLIANITSRDRTTPVEDEFAIGSAEWLMEIEKAPSSIAGGGELLPVEDFTIELFGSNQILLRWKDGACGGTHRVDYTSNPGDPDSWVVLSESQDGFALDTTENGALARFYRVVTVQ